MEGTPHSSRDKSSLKWRGDVPEHIDYAKKQGGAPLNRECSAKLDKGVNLELFVVSPALLFRSRAITRSSDRPIVDDTLSPFGKSQVIQSWQS
jgi:hypothetical protein